MSSSNYYNGPLTTSSAHSSIEAYNFFNSVQATSPNATPTGRSPTSPSTTSSSPIQLRNAFKHEQLRKPRNPMYVPAVLRPTEYQARCGQRNKGASSSSLPKMATTTASRGPTGMMTPPSSAGTSFDSADGSSMADIQMAAARNIMLGDEYFKSKMHRVVADEWNDDAMEEVAGFPTKEHWKPDNCSKQCDEKNCEAPFTMLTRRHHCRRCGNVYCADHTKHFIPLDQHARFHPEGVPSKGCNDCFSDLGYWRGARSHRSSISSGLMSGNATPTGEEGSGSSVRSIPKQEETTHVPMAASVSKGDYNGGWSTF